MFSESVHSSSLPVSAIVHQLFNSHFIRFYSICSMHFCSIIRCSVARLLSAVFCPDTGIEFQVFQSYKPISTTIWQVNKHHTSDGAIFCLSIGSESLLPSQTLVECPEPTSPNRVSRGRDTSMCIGTRRNYLYKKTG
jgi:hypothetical protein